jgi:hypothetical protein
MIRDEDVTSQEVAQSLQKIILEPHALGYMTQALADQIEGMVIGSATARAAQMIAQGIPNEVAGVLMADAIPVFGFALGLTVGRELQASKDFVQMMGGLGGDPTDAGDSQ